MDIHYNWLWFMWETGEWCLVGAMCQDIRKDCASLACTWWIESNLKYTYTLKDVHNCYNIISSRLVPPFYRAVIPLDSICACEYMHARVFDPNANLTRKKYYNSKRIIRDFMKVFIEIIYYAIVLCSRSAIILHLIYSILYNSAYYLILQWYKREKSICLPWND